MATKRTTADEPANAGRKQRGGFQPGQSGNPRSKLAGTRHRVTLLAEKLLQDDADGVVRAVLTAAKAGDMTACRLILDRTMPPRRGRPVAFPLPPVQTAADLPAALAAIVAAVAAGLLTPDEGQGIAAVLDCWRKGVETTGLADRMDAIERAIGQGSGDA
jgi:hypothetical protein